MGQHETADTDTDVTTIDVSNSPELLRLAEEVRATGKPLVLRRGGEELARVVPAPSVRRGRRLKPKKLTEEDIAAFRSAAGGWRGLVDTDKLIEDIYESRRRSTKAAPELRRFWLTAIGWPITCRENTRQ